MPFNPDDLSYEELIGKMNHTELLVLCQHVTGVRLADGVPKETLQRIFNGHEEVTDEIIHPWADRQELLGRGLDMFRMLTKIQRVCSSCLGTFCPTARIVTCWKKNQHHFTQGET